MWLKGTFLEGSVDIDMWCVRKDRQDESGNWGGDVGGGFMSIN